MFFYTISVILLRLSQVNSVFSNLMVEIMLSKTWLHQRTLRKQIQTIGLLN